MKKETLVQTIIIVVLAIISVILIKATIDEMRFPRQMAQGFPFEEKIEKNTKADDVAFGTEVTEDNINLSKYNTNLTITKPGEYMLNGKFAHSVLVNTDKDVTLALNGVEIKNDITASIANIGCGTLTIRLLDNTVNTLEDGGSSEYDACIYSNGPLVIEGTGELNVFGKQIEGEGIATDSNAITINSGKIRIECEDDGLNAGGDGGTITINGGDVYIKANGDGIDSNKDLVINGGTIYTVGSALGGDAGIDTDAGFEINGGTVIALGSDMLEKPKESSKQKFVCFNENSKIMKGAKISLKNEALEEIIIFDADEDFRTLIISDNKLVSGIYKLYKDGENTNWTATIK